MLAPSAPSMSSSASLLRKTLSRPPWVVAAILRLVPAGPLGPWLRHLLRGLIKAGGVYTGLMLVFGGLYERPWEIVGVLARFAYVLTRALADYAARGFRPLFPEWTLPFELVRAALRCVMSSYGHRLLVEPNARFIRRQSEVAGTVLGFFTCRAQGTRTESLRFNNLEHMWIREAPTTTTTTGTSSQGQPQRRRRFVVLFFHGGGFAVLSPRMYIPFGSELLSRLRRELCALLPDDTGAAEDVRLDVLLANYRKIPEHPHPIPPQDAVKMYHYLLEHEGYAPHEIIVAGDSAGGGLAMATLLRIRDRDPGLLPLAGLLSCPFVDLEIGGDERKVPHCIIGDRAGIAIYAGYHPRKGAPETWGDASPVHCDLRGLPPVYIQTAALDYLHPHATRLFARAQAQGLKGWELDVFANVPHVFTNFPVAILPHAAKGLDAMAAFAARTFARALETGDDAPAA